ncbi:MAG: FecR domain-containing protein [Bacteroidota bacterium]
MTDPNQSQRITLLAQKWQEGTITESEKAEFEAWYLLFDDVLEVNTNERREEAENRIYQTILQRGSIPANRKNNWPRAFVIAASMLLGLSIGGYFLLNKTNHLQPNRQAQQSVYYSPIGRKKSVTLPDGTVVLLNSGSQLTLLPGYGQHMRSVTLAGEAYFTVVHDPKSPFSVHTPGFDVNDLGTVFNVKAYAGDRTSEAVLIKGSVEVVLKNKFSSRVLLAPNKKLIILNHPLPEDLAIKTEQPRAEYKVTGIANNVFKNSIVETDWTNDKLSFYDQQFEDIVPVIERWYDVKLMVNNKQLSGYRFTATFDKENIDQVLKALKLTANFNYRREGNVITVY